MRILLIQFSAENREAYPLGLGYVAAVLIESGHTVSFLDLAFHQGEGAKRITEVAQASGAQALGFTVMTPQYNEFCRLIRKIRPSLADVPIIVGGPHGSALPEEVLRHGVADIVVLSEGEATAPDLFFALEKDEDLTSVPGIAFLGSTHQFVQTAPREQIADLDGIPFPPWGMFQPERYQGRIGGLRRANVLTSRGCPFRCSFCYRGPTSGLRYRKRSIENVLEEVRQLHHNYGIGGFAFRDDIFTLDMDHARRFCDRLKAEKLRMVWLCETRVDRVDLDLLKRMKRSGCVTVEFGVESGNDEIRKRLRKNITKEQIRQAFRYCHELGIPSVALFMIGTPWDTPETVDETIAFAKELRATTTLFFMAIPFPGTELRQEFLNAGWDVPEDYDEYRHFVELAGFTTKGGEKHTTNPRHYFAAQCRRATREITVSQIRDVRHYPELLRSYLLRHSIGSFTVKAAQRLRRIV